MSGYEQELTIPFFYGKIDTEAYLDWEKKMEFLFGLQYYTEKKKVCLAVNGLCGSAFSWWQRVSQTRRFDKKTTNYFMGGDEDLDEEEVCLAVETSKTKIRSSNKAYYFRSACLLV